MKPASSSARRMARHAAVHHVGGRDDVDSGARQRDRSARQEFEAGVVVDFEFGFNRARHDRGQLVDDFFFFLAVLHRRGALRSTQSVSGGRAQGLRRGFHDPAVSVRHVFAEADVAHQNQVGDFALHGSGSLLHDAVVGPGSGGDVIFLVGKTEENHRGHAQGVNFLRLFHRFIHRKVEHARHRANFLAHAFAGANEHGVDEGLGSEAGFAHQVPKLGGAAETAKTGDRKGHGNHLARIERLSTLDSSRSGVGLGSQVLGVRAQSNLSLYLHCRSLKSQDLTPKTIRPDFLFRAVTKVICQAESKARIPDPVHKMRVG